METPKDIPGHYKVCENFRCHKFHLVLYLVLEFVLLLVLVLVLHLKSIYSIDSLVSWPVVYHRELHLQHLFEHKFKFEVN